LPPPRLYLTSIDEFRSLVVRPSVPNIPAVDLFAGPGGLSEGFAQAGFNVVLSIEKDPAAHKTLELRSFFRQFPPGRAPEDYYRYLRGELSREDLFRRHPIQARRARAIAWHAELGVAREDVVDARIRRALQKPEHWVLLGGPPCKAYSVAGRARRANDPTFATDNLHTLYVHYLRILAVHRPSVFVFENVKGLLSSRLESEPAFAKIVDNLRHPTTTLANWNGHLEPVSYIIRSFVLPSYETQELRGSDFIIKAEQHGVPQARHRVILLGIRSDLEAEPETLKRRNEIPADWVLRDLPRLRSLLSREPDSYENWLGALSDISSSALLRGVDSATRHCIQQTLSNLKPSREVGARFLSTQTGPCGLPQDLADWFIDDRLGGVCNHEARSHRRDDLHRYMFAACFARIHNRTPFLEDFPEQFLPNHKNISKAGRDSTNFNDRFRVQLAGKPSTTITSHIAKDGHYFIHYDPTQCRSLTVREAARLQTFPDNYLFEGNRTEQYVQVGNAVPPFLAFQLAVIVRRILERSTKRSAIHPSYDRTGHVRV
jgi:DNA (cytosine-5)-methyltransferase 1